MNCDNVTLLLLDRSEGSNSIRLPLEADAHLAECETCRALRDALDSHSETNLPDETSRNIVDLLTRDLKPVEPLPPRWVLVLHTTVIFVFLPALFAVGVHGSDLIPASKGQVLGTLWLIGTCEIFLSLNLVSLMVPGCRPRVQSFKLAALCLGAFFLAAGSLFPASPEPVTASGIPCIAACMGISLPAAAGLYLVARRGTVLDWMRAGAVIGALATFTGVTALVAYCDIFDRAHQILWHGGLLVTGTISGLVWGGLKTRMVLPKSSVPRP